MAHLAFNPDPADDRHDDTARLWLSQQQWMSILERVERQVLDSTPQGDNQRQSPRLPAPHHARCMIRLGHPCPDRGTYQVRLRNISTSGLGFLSAAPFQPKSRCTVALQDAEGHGLVCAARIVWCRALDDDLSAVGVQFDKPIDPERFVVETTDDAPPDEPTG